MINPLTGRKIKRNGPTHKMLMKEVHSLKRSLKRTPTSRKVKRSKIRELIKKSLKREGRGSRVRGWASMSPQKGKERHELMHKCGKKCFLDPENEMFPICAAVREGKGCKIDCRGLLSSKVRAKQFKYEDIAKLAEKLEKKLCM